MDPWQVLGVPRWATQREIDAAWRRRLLKLDPNRHADLMTFTRLLVAYQLVTQPEDQRGSPLATDPDDQVAHLDPSEEFEPSPDRFQSPDSPESQLTSVAKRDLASRTNPSSPRAEWLGWDSPDCFKEALIEARRQARNQMWAERLVQTHRLFNVLKLGISLSVVAVLGVILTRVIYDTTSIHEPFSFWVFGPSWRFWVDGCWSPSRQAEATPHPTIAPSGEAGVRNRSGWVSWGEADPSTQAGQYASCRDLRNSGKSLSNRMVGREFH